MKIFIGYILIGCLWILFSDKVVSILFSDAEEITRIQTYKGWIYVMTTGILFYFILRHHIRKLRTAEQMAKESDRLKTLFLQNISHEIRTPMNGIMGFTELLKNETLTEAEKNEFLKIISDSSTLLLNIVNEVLDISMIESGTNKVKISEVSLNNLMDEILNYFTHSVGNDVCIKVEYGLSSGNDVIKADETKIRQILHNLISNAIKFVENGHIRFGYKAKENTLEFFVEDTGIGISKESQKHIFERFFKDRPQNTKIYDGVGLGLAISKGLVELLEGKIWLESEPGKGSIFAFAIPYQKVDDKHEDSISYSGEKARTRQSTFNYLTILLVEDDLPNIKYITEILSRQGIKVITAVNGQQAVDLCHDHQEIELVLMDLKMPVMDGYLSAKEIRELRRDIYIVAQTAYVFNEREKTTVAGFNDFLAKPFNVEQLFAVINRFLERQHQ